MLGRLWDEGMGQALDSLDINIIYFTAQYPIHITPWWAWALLQIFLRLIKK